jgi:hypothetical protein
MIKNYDVCIFILAMISIGSIIAGDHGADGYKKPTTDSIEQAERPAQQPQNSQSIHKAIRENNVELVREMLNGPQAHKYVDEVNNRGETPLL